jgi:hypothetical protein
MARATRRTPRRPRGRSLIALGLLGLLGVASIVVWRRSRALAEARIVRDLTNERRTLISQRTGLERDLQNLSSRARVVPAAEKRLGMHVATELEVHNLPPQVTRDSVP